MDKLIESMLPISTWLSPDYRSGLIIYRIPISVVGFAIALHIPLLEIGSKAVHILVVWKYRLTFSTKKIGVPDPQ